MCVKIVGAQTEIFIENKGQFPNKVKAFAALNIGNLWVCEDGLWFHFWDTDKIMEIHDKSLESLQIPSHAVQLKFKNANFSQIEYTGSKSQDYINFFRGKNPLKWVSGIHKYSKLNIKQIFPEVDLEIIASQGSIKYNWICSPSKLKELEIEVIGAELNQTSKTTLAFKTSIVQWEESIPLVYDKSNPNSPIDCQYKIEKNTIRYEILGATPNRRNAKIVIDPILVFSSYSGSRADNFGCTGTYDELGNGYSGGTVFAAGLPTTTGAFQIKFGGGKPEDLGYGGSRDAAILKFNSTGSSLLFSTYLGGSDNEQPHSMVVDSMHNLYVMGTTKSQDFPITINSYDPTHNGSYDFYVTKFNSFGTQIVSSTFIGGSGQDGVGADRSINPVDNYPLIYNYADEFRGEIITDNKNIYVCGSTYSTDFPYTGNLTVNTVEQDAVVFCLNAQLTSLKWSQVLGDNDKYFDAFYGLALGKNDDLYCAGGTNSTGLKSIYSSNWLNTGLGDVDAILVRYNKNNGVFLSGKYYGTNAYEQAYFVQTDLSGNPYIFGQTEGNIPIINSRFNQPGTGQFITKHNEDLSQIVIQTTFGANGNMPNISPSAFLVDRCERIFVSGWGGTTNTALYDVNTGNPKIHRNKGNTKNLSLTSDAIQKTSDGSDFYIAVFSKNMYDLAFATYFGGVSTSSKKAEEHVDGGTSRFDKKGIIYQSVCAGCRQNGLFPTTVGAYSRTVNSNNCNNALFKIDFENLNKKPFMKDSFIKVTATQNISTLHIAYDNDVFDTVKLLYKWISRGGMTSNDTAIVTTYSAINHARLTLNWNTKCTSFSKDTAKLLVTVIDCGCPQADTTYTILSILVEEPPIVVPPDAICVSYDRQTTQMKISWPQITIPTVFFKYFLLQKTSPSGTKQIVDTIFSNVASFYLDQNVISPQTNNYCYELIGVNICDVKIYPNFKYCTIRELNNSIEPVNIINATVFEDRRVDVKWEKSQEPDFKEFEIYKYPLGGTVPANPSFIQKDTFLRDSSFNVDKQSFCYRIMVIDKCGHISKLSNQGCNIIINGSSVEAPDYYFNLNWANYVEWDSGVDHWVLERQYSDIPFTSVYSSNQNRFFKDVNLDFDWGGYWYRAIAFEKPSIGKKTVSTSESNWIFLYQPPEVWVPDAFTVNDDHLNEVWGTCPIFVKGYSMKVYDRWGQKIWESFDKKKQWDGTIDGKQVPDGVYAWLLNFDGWDKKHYQKTGTVMIIH